MPREEFARLEFIAYPLFWTTSLEVHGKENMCFLQRIVAVLQNKLNNLFIYLLFLVYLFKMGTTKRWLKWLTWTLKRSVLLRFGAGDFKSETFSRLITLQFHSSTPGANWLAGEGMQALALFISQCCQISNGWTTVKGHHLSNSFRTQWKTTTLKAINCQYAST